MTIQERVQDIFNKFNVNLKVEESRTELAEATLENGTVIYTDGDDFVEEGDAYIINDEGERIPLPPGDYTLADGGVISIGDIGKINKVQKPVSDGKGGEGKGAEGKPSNVPNIDVTKPAKKKDSGDGGDSGGKSGKKGKKKLSSDEEQTTDMKVELNAEQVFSMLQERFPDIGEEVAQAIAVAVEEIYAQPEPEVEAEEEEEKEEMQVNPEAPKAEAEVEVEVEVEAETEPEAEEAKEELSAETEKSEIDLLKEALAQTNERLEQLHKMSAHGGLKHKAPSTPKAEPLDLANMTIEERVRALANQLSK